MRLLNDNVNLKIIFYAIAAVKECNNEFFVLIFISYFFFINFAICIDVNLYQYMIKQSKIKKDLISIILIISDRFQISATCLCYFDALDIISGQINIEIILLHKN